MEHSNFPKLPEGLTLEQIKDAVQETFSFEDCDINLQGEYMFTDGYGINYTVGLNQNKITLEIEVWNDFKEENENGGVFNLYSVEDLIDKIKSGPVYADD